MKIISTPRRMKLFWQLAKQWFTRQFEAVASSIDFTEVEGKIDDVKDDVADVKSAVENIDFSTLATEANATANKEAIVAAMPSVPTVQQIQNGLATESNATSNKEAIIAAMSEISVDTSNLATKNLEQFFNITGATSYTAASTVEILNELVSIWEDVFDAHPAEVSIEGTYIVRYVDGHHMYEFPIPDENTLG